MFNNLLRDSKMGEITNQLILVREGLEADAQKVSTEVLPAMSIPHSLLEFEDEFDHVDLLALSSKIVATYFSAAEIDPDNHQALDGSPFIFSMLFCWIMAKLQANKIGNPAAEHGFREQLFAKGYGKYFCTSAVTYVYMICSQPQVREMFDTLGINLQIRFSLDHTWLATFRMFCFIPKPFAKFFLKLIQNQNLRSLKQTRKKMVTQPQPQLQLFNQQMIQRKPPMKNPGLLKKPQRMKPQMLPNPIKPNLRLLKLNIQDLLWLTLKT